MTTAIKEELRKSGRIVFTNKGRSMMPLLRQDRDLMVIETPDRPYRRLDAVLFEREDGRLILHRILKVKDGGYWIIGDNCSSGEYVKESSVLGLLTGIKRGKRTISVSDPGYRLYVLLWCAPYPFRILLQFLWRLPRRCAGKIARTVKKRWKHSA